jgi:hypothetical protein
VGGKLAKAADFSALHRFAEDEIGRIKGIAALTVYDVAHRIGAHFGKAPQLVYLHAGTRKGAGAFGINGESFDPRTLPKAFSHLTPAEIEDCMCIYKDELCNEARSRIPQVQMRCCSSATVRWGVICGSLLSNPIKYIIVFKHKAL